MQFMVFKLDIYSKKAAVEQLQTLKLLVVITLEL